MSERPPFNFKEFRDIQKKLEYLMILNHFDDNLVQKLPISRPLLHRKTQIFLFLRFPKTYVSDVSVAE